MLTQWKFLFILNFKSLLFIFITGRRGLGLVRIVPIATRTTKHKTSRESSPRAKPIRGAHHQPTSCRLDGRFPTHSPAPAHTAQCHRLVAATTGAESSGQHASPSSMQLAFIVSMMLRRGRRSNQAFFLVATAAAVGGAHETPLAALQTPQTHAAQTVAAESPVLVGARRQRRGQRPQLTHLVASARLLISNIVVVIFAVSVVIFFVLAPMTMMILMSLATSDGLSLFFYSTTKKKQ